MQDVKFRCAPALFVADAKKKHYELCSVHNGSIYGASRIGNT